MNIFSKPYSRRRFLAGTTSLAALYAAGKFVPLRAMAQSLPNDPRIDKQPIVDKGYALVRKIGNGVYATVSDRSKGLQTRSNGGFIVGRDGALLVEGFQTPIGASFQMDALRMVSKVPVHAAIDTHWHFDHTLGNSFYIDKGWRARLGASESGGIPQGEIHPLARGNSRCVSCSLGEACNRSQNRQPA